MRRYNLCVYSWRSAFHLPRSWLVHRWPFKIAIQQSAGLLLCQLEKERFHKGWFAGGSPPSWGLEGCRHNPTAVNTIRLLDDRQAWLRGNVVDDTGRPRRTDDESVRDRSKEAFLDFPVKDPPVLFLELRRLTALEHHALLKIQCLKKWSQTIFGWEPWQ